MAIKIQPLSTAIVEEQTIEKKQEQPKVERQNAYSQALKTHEKQERAETTVLKTRRLILKREDKKVVFRKKAPWKLSVESLNKIKTLANRTNQTQEELMEWVISHLEWEHE